MIDMLLIDDVFDMSGGYVLNFTDRTFREFFARELRINIDDPKFATNGASKGKRLRYFLQTADQPTALRTLQALWEYREALRMHAGSVERVENAEQRMNALIARLGGGPTVRPKPEPEVPAKTDAGRIRQLSGELTALAKLAPQPRGYAFEKFLKSLFDAYGLQGRDPFRIRGEQIDGSFELSHETYLLEAKWQNAFVGAADLYAFNGKVEEKAAWARGLFISYCGFSEDGLHAFGRGKRLICMDGLDLSETLMGGLSLTDVLRRKVRRAAETGQPFVRVRDL
ncbi:restriction endonuclease [Brevundimonas lenta]|uniref:Restriction endonuclease type IV Mrr domain-containing protein n=1 Tax=Brevundimonas lenta TaxID=424796 RepID=A0A7W6NR97_9CAUL|nr:restriction endonuclease [Brevundimonas lenta]MBB4084032.1 hypothetical protein [Brevundimonas lenta]